ncbi:MAG: 1-deoxy-D-xylulose-5-phosphate reductoisomerase [Armatimonadetes bacterium]|nr:1-deoxy-D-xylulose-5-phosphate reductoisomerase [Armatimonadota bacterium]
MTKRISVLGSTGSIGTQVLDVAERLPEMIEVVALAAHSNVELLAEQARRFRPQLVSIAKPELEPELGRLIGRLGIRIVSGEDGWIAAATLSDVDQVVVAMAGTPGLMPTLAATDAGKDIALASKEVLVCAGEIVSKRAAERGVKIVPIDSEHSAIFQCLNGEDLKTVEKIYLTASGGPFGKIGRDSPNIDLSGITPEQALAHPTWRMGRKVTIDSATLMNKGLEIIEARWLFGVDPDNIEVVIHPQSIVHSMVQFADGSVMAQLGLPDMRLPIQYALLYPLRYDSGLPRVTIHELAALDFRPPDFERFPALGLAYRAARTGGTMPAVMNAADEVAVQLFLDGRIGFLDITRFVECAMNAHEPVHRPSLEQILAADAWSREITAALAGGSEVGAFC